MSILVLVLLFLTGLFVGMVGIGGFLVVPVLVLLAGMKPQHAVALAAISFVCLGCIALVGNVRRVDIGLRRFVPFMLASVVGALAGALIVGVLMNRALAWLIAGAFACAGVAEWLGWPREPEERSITGATSAALGVLTGLGSVITGTSGPMVALPALSWLGVPTRERIRMAQIVQLPIAATAAAAFASFGEVPWGSGIETAAALGVGFVAGLGCMQRFSPRTLSRTVAILMLLAAGSMLLAAIQPGVA